MNEFYVFRLCLIAITLAAFAACVLTGRAVKRIAAARRRK